MNSSRMSRILKEYFLQSFCDPSIKSLEAQLYHISSFVQLPFQRCPHLNNNSYQELVEIAEIS